MFNSGFRGKRASDGTGVVNPQDKFIQGKYPVPTIDSWTISGSDDAALDPAGGQTVLVNGGGFVAGCAVTVNGVTISPVTIVNSNQISFTSPALAGGSYSLIVYNSAGGAAILVPGLTYSSVPTWTTSAGSIGTYYETTAIDETLVATSDSSITYSLTSGSLPDGSTLYANGVITGSAPIDSSSTTYTFAVTATDEEDQDVTRTFTLTINTDVVTWVTPSSGSTINLDGTSYSQSLTATDAASYAITYSANALPTGLTLSSGTISGTPTEEGSTTTLLTATAATTNRSATNTITWVVALSDVYWKNVSLLLSGSTPTTTFINDASLNNSQLTIVGDTKPTSFNPYEEGYYGISFDGASYALGTATAGVTIGTSDFCLEGWGFWTSFNYGQYGAPLLSMLGDTAGELMIRANKTSASTTSANFFSILGGSTYIPSSMFSSGVSVGTLYLNRWHHLAIQRVSGTWYFYIDGVMLNSTSAGNASLTLPFTKFYIGSDAASGGGYQQGVVSNVRLIVGSAPYSTSGFTVPTAPLTNVANTKFLSAQSNLLKDNSITNTFFTKSGAANITAICPFTPPTVALYDTQYSTYFDGTSGHLSVPTNTALSMDSGNFSAECWCYLTKYQSSGTPVMVDKSGKGYVSYSHWSINSKNGYWGFDIGISGTPGTQILAVQTSTLTIVNQWHHVALVKTGTTYSLFLNGTRIHTATSATVPADNNPLPMAIGFSTDQTSLSYWFGYIADVRVNKGTLPTGYDATQTTITVPSARLTAVTGTTFLSCQNSTLKDNSTNNLTINSISPAKPVALSPFTMTTSSTTVTSLGSAYFDGTGDYLTLPENTGLWYLGTGDFTIESWIYPTARVTNGAYIIARSQYGVNSDWTFNVLNAGTLQFYMLTGGSNIVTSSGTIPLNTWSHVSVVRTGTTIKLYINGVNDGTLNSFSSALTSSYGPTTIGNSSNNTGSTYFPGYMNNLRVVKGTAIYTSNFLPSQTPLTAVSGTSLLTCQYNGGANNNGIIDQSNFNNILTRVGNTTQGTFSPYSQTGWSNYFNGSSYYYTPAALKTAMGTGFSGNIITIESWIYPTTLSGGNTYSAITGAYAAVGANGRWWFGFSNAGNLTFTYTTGTASEDNIIATGGGLTANQWHHVVVAIDATTNTNTTVNIYLNGSRIVNATGKNFSSQTAYYDAPWLGGNFSQYVNSYTGYMSNFRITKGQVVYTGTSFTPSTTPLTPTQYTALLTFQSNKIVDNSANQYALTLVAGSHSVQAFSPFSGVTSVPTSYSTQFISGTTYLRTNNNTNTVPGTGDFTVEGWFYLTSSVSANQAMFNLGAYDNGILLRSISSGFDVWINNVQVYNAVGSGSYTINAWYHIALTRQGTNLRLFLNGTQLGTTASNNANITASSAPNYLLGNSAHAASSDIMVGYMSNWRVIKGQALFTGSFTPSTAPLTTTTVGATGAGAASSITGTVELLTMQNSTIIDNSYNNATITATGTLLQKELNPFGNTNTPNVSYTPAVNGGSIYMDGSGDYLSAATSSSFDLSSGPWTIECWFYQLAAKTVQLFSVGASAWRLALASNQGAEFTFNGSSTMLFASGTFPLNQWNHIAVTFNADGTGTAVKTFANGKYIGAGQFWPSASSSIFYVGRNTDAGSGWDFNGYITDISITKGRSKYNASFVPSSTPLSVNSNTAFLMNGTSGGIIDYHSSSNLETAGNTQLGSEDPYSGTYYSVYTNGDDTRLSVPAGTAFNMGSGDFSIEMWVNPISTSTYGALLTFDAADYPICIYYGSGVNGGNIMAAAGTTSAWFANTSAMTFGTTVPGKWSHILLTRSGDNWRCFQDGVLRYYATQSGTVGDSSGSIYIGANGSSIYRVVASISNLRIIKGSIPTSYQTSSTTTGTTIFTPSTSPLTTTSQGATASQVSLLTCQSNKFIDNSLNGFTVTNLNSGMKVKSMNPFQQNTGKSLYFDGTGDYLSTGQLGIANLDLVTGDFTIEAWVYNASPGAERYILSQRGSSSGWELRINSSNTMQFFFTGGSSQTSSGTIPPNQWVYIAVTRSVNSLKLYINGTLDSTNASFTNGTSASSAYPVYIGNSTSAGGGLFLGYMKELRITKGIVRTITVPTAPFKSS